MIGISKLARVKSRIGIVSLGDTVVFDWDGINEATVLEIVGSGRDNDFLLKVKANGVAFRTGFLSGRTTTLVAGGRLIKK